jgi:hypothetical protein
MSDEFFNSDSLNGFSNSRISNITMLAGVKIAAAITYGFGWLSLVCGPIAGILLANRELSEEKYSAFFEQYYTTSSKPFVGLGIGLAAYGIIFGSFFIAIGGHIFNKSE